jgi:hypothetical protein
MMKIKNKNNSKGQIGHGILWIWKFIMLVFVLGGVISIVLAHYSMHYDIRDQENSILSKKVLECIAPENRLDVISEEKINSCLSLDKNEVYIKIKNNDYTFELGSNSLDTLCKAKETTNIKYYPSCLNSTYYVLKNNEMTKLEIFTAIKKVEYNL